MPKRKGRSDGEGSIFEYPKGSGQWFAQVRLPSGRTKRHRATTQREARELLRQMQADVDQGVNLSAKQLTVAEWCKLWLEAFSPNLKQNIREDYTGVIRRTIEGTFIGRRKLDQLTPADVQSWVNTLGKQVAPQTVRNAHARLRKALAVAVRHGYVARNVAVGIELPQVRPLPIQPFDFGQTRALLRGLEGHRWYALYRLAVNLGLREGDCSG